MLTLTILNASQHEQYALDDEPWLLGSRATDRARTITIVDDRVAAEHLQLTATKVEDRLGVRIFNSGRMTLLPTGRRLLAGVSCELPLPVQITIGKTIVLVADPNQTYPVDESLTALPHLDEDPVRFATEMDKMGSAPSASTLAFWFEALGKLQRSIPGSSEFYHEAAYAAFDPGGMDAAMVLLRDGANWRIAGGHVSSCELGAMYRPALLERVVQERCTLFHDARRTDANRDGSCAAFVAVSPVMDVNRNVAGCVYAARYHHKKNLRRGIRPLEAQFIQAVADAVSAGLVRQQREAEAAHARVRFEQAFSPRVVRALERDPHILDGMQREVSVVFCDLRAFSRIAEQVSARELHMLLGDIMDRFTDQVARRDGVVIDYFGDGMACFWNAPLDQSDHATLAVTCATEMLNELPDISADWYPLIGRPLIAGIGVHTGTAVVGNSGSRRRIKYGPRGHTVNVASRIEGFAKKCGLGIVVSEQTRSRLDSRLRTRSLTRTSLPGMDESFQLHEVIRQTPTAGEEEWYAKVARAAQLAETGNFVDCREVLEADGDGWQRDPFAKYLMNLCGSAHK